MSNFRLLNLCAVLIITNFVSISGFKCKYEIVEGSAENDIKDVYFCYVVMDPNAEEVHLSGKHDEDTKFIFLEKGRKTANFSQADFPYCQKFKNLNKVHLNELKSIDRNSFEHCKNLETIRIHKGIIQDVPENLFLDNSKLTNLELKKNKFTTLPENIFKNNKELVTLNLNDNKITTFPANVFKSLSKLKYLWLEDNKIQFLEPAWFGSLGKLEILDLSDNKITDLPKNVFASLINLKKLNLNDNKITVIHSDSFGTHGKFERIDFEDNKIGAIDEKFIDRILFERFLLDDNACVKKDFNEGDDIKGAMKKCFENYQPRE